MRRSASETCLSRRTIGAILRRIVTRRDYKVQLLLIEVLPLAPYFRICYDVGDFGRFRRKSVFFAFVGILVDSKQTQFRLILLSLEYERGPRVTKKRLKNKTRTILQKERKNRNYFFVVALFQA